MMAIKKWPNCLLVSHVKDNIYNFQGSRLAPFLPFNSGRTKSIRRVGPHNIDVLSIIICGMLGDFWGNKIKGQQMDSVRFIVEQGVNNSAYIHHLNLILHELESRKVI